MNNYSCRSHSTESHLQLSDATALRVKDNAEGGVDDGDVVLATSRLLVRREIFIGLRRGDGYGHEHLVRFDDVLAVAGEERVVHDHTTAASHTLQFQDASGGQKDGIQVRDGRSRHDVAGDGRHVADLFAGEPVNHFHDGGEYSRRLLPAPIHFLAQYLPMINSLQIRLVYVLNTLVNLMRDS